MSMIRFMFLFLPSLATYILLDLVWLGLLMRDFYLKHLSVFSRLAGKAFSLHIPTAIATWTLIVLGALFFVLPLISRTNVWYSFMVGACYGFVVYGVYNLTNYAVLPQWPAIVVLVDTAWGIAINGVFGIVLFYLERLSRGI